MSNIYFKFWVPLHIRFEWEKCHKQRCIKLWHQNWRVCQVDSPDISIQLCGHHKRWCWLLCLCRETRRKASAKSSKGWLPSFRNYWAWDVARPWGLAWALQAWQVIAIWLSQSKYIKYIFYRDQYVTINYGNIRPGTERNFQRFNPSQVLLHGNYDYGSVMHYSRCGFSDNGFETITPTVGSMSPTSYVLILILSCFRTHLQLLVKEQAWARSMSTSLWAFISAKESACCVLQ